jgi:YfiH family protein
MNLEMLRPDWPVPAAVQVAFSTRIGGVSTGRFASLNVATHVGDDAVAVAENRRRLRSALALPAEPLWLRQVHGIGVCDVDAVSGATAPAEPPTADAAVTRVPGRVLAIQVADCLPVVLAAADASVVAVAHAGWRGLVAGVLEAAVAATGAPAPALHAWIGPAISAANFEVGTEVRAAFVAVDPRAASAFEPNARGRWQCDLARLARQRLAALGLQSISDCGLCTHADAGRFFSYRRDGETGRQTALVWLRP